jgi:hypothetical protein
MKNTLVKLLHLLEDNNAMIGGGFYYKKYFPLESVGMHVGLDDDPTRIKDYKIGDIIHNTLVLPSGCTLIKFKVFLDMEFPWYRTITVQGKPALTEDTYFCQKARAMGLDILTDTGLQCIHVDKERGIFYGHKDIVDVIEQGPNIITIVKPEWRDKYAAIG